MDKKADLHCHSIYSDGSKTPKELIDLAVTNGFFGLSITDHDTLKAYDEAIPYAKEKGLLLLPGIEISAEEEEEEVHILGYGFSPTNKEIVEFCIQGCKMREKRAESVLEKLKELGMTITLDEIAALSPEASSFGRVHIAFVMVQKGFVKDVKEAFDKYLRRGRPCYYAPGLKWKPQEVIDTVHACHGKVVLAHPHLMKNKSLVSRLLDLSFDGIEAYYCRFSKEENAPWVREGEKRGWLLTGGSDFHGSTKPHVPFGASWADEKTFLSLYNLYQSQV
jgi:3',5'-nucleoside bisphosphate phosphatase